jgi:hypothetical protein
MIMLCLQAFPGYTQEEPVDSAGSASQPEYPAWFIKLSPLAILEIPQPSLQLAVEYRLSWPFYLQHEVGWMPSFDNSGQIFGVGSYLHGFKIKSEIRYYLDEEDPFASKPRRTYLALEAMYRMRTVRDERWYQMGDGAFSQWLVRDQYRQQLGIHFKVGRHVKLSEKGRLFADSFVGIGLRRYFASYEYLSNQFSGTTPPMNSYNFVAPSLTLGFKLGVAVR